jgi:hypothetical protein
MHTSDPNQPDPATGVGAQRSVARQVRLSLAAAAAGILVLAGAVALAWARGISLEEVAADPGVGGGEELTVGTLTRVEVLVWTAAAAIAVAAGLLGRRLAAPEAPVLLAFGGAAAVLVADDALLIHEVAADAGLPRGSLQAVYGAAVLYLLWRFRVPLLSATPWILLIVACGWLASSAITDALLDNLAEGDPSSEVRAVNFAEDGLKVIGILTWSLYLVLVSRSLALSLPHPPPKGDARRSDPPASMGAVRRERDSPPATGSE